MHTFFDIVRDMYVPVLRITDIYLETKESADCAKTPKLGGFTGRTLWITVDMADSALPRWKCAGIFVVALMFARTRKDIWMDLVKPLLCSIPAAATALGVSRSKTYELISEGLLLTVSIGRRRLVRMDSIEAIAFGEAA